MFYHVTYAFSMDLHFVIAWMLKNSLRKTGAVSESWVNKNETWTQNQLAKLVKCSFTNWVVVGLSPVAVTSIFLFFRENIIQKHLTNMKWKTRESFNIIYSLKRVILSFVKKQNNFRVHEVNKFCCLQIWITEDRKVLK